MTQDVTLPRVERTFFNEESAWIKRPEAPRSSRFVLFHKVMERILPEALHYTGTAGGMRAIQQEAKNLKLFNSALLPVPEVLDINDNSIVLSDTGDQLREILHQTDKKTDRHAMLERALHGLKAVHNAGLCHGRPFLKDMTIDAEGKFYFIDLEENPCEKMSLEDAQARDVWLFLCSCTEFCDNPLEELSKLLAVYRAEGGCNIDSNLQAIGKGLRPFQWLISILHIKNLSKDLRGAYWSIKVLNQKSEYEPDTN